MTMADL